jgi:hypothetical protein
MPSIVTYPDGSILTSTALSDNQVETALQLLSAQVLGILISPLNLNVTLTANSPNAVVDSASLLYDGVTISATGIPPGTTILSISGVNIVLSNNATISGTEPAIAQDLKATSVVRIGWQQQGQPGPSINSDTLAITAEPIDTPFSRLRDSVQTTIGTINTQLDVFTRTWRVSWAFYGPHSLDYARAVKSAWTMVSFVDNFLSNYNLFVNPEIEEPSRNPDLFQSQWWERVTMKAEFSEQVTETLTVGTVESVEVKVYTKDGQLADITIP